ncbi:UDP-N-acetylmuramoyl-L-alanine--D-glutamate ligase [Legionella parisiensis]|uniref:UDP-N-acetylmuramoylalanine--D-glutamate ligase n=1 Tax=Legionella parisiensis TaxID=45071 RepID=A0A1E5JUR5_9GAMM|nr:UDP-N-acetylmuramoyl-L-alanine--D-glutamate ligase [Legionella parisiensis]KTD43144.1 UDP-N-acetylmuramoyl-L-alanyl-D-glutamate synthetase [Legionella parisiensis]OEH48259.1 UDP-N-acetylmuramoylalanine--D-glutamate ligase [Legionella parisiensis]STX77777.1 UDP-N-acetylmuramoylalanine--D-glutamate ligase [Legionella parisiensis]
MDFLSVNSPTSVVLGLDGFGLSCFEFLAKRGVSVCGTYNLNHIKTRISPVLYQELVQTIAELTQRWPESEINAQFFDERILNKADQIILSPGISYWDPILDNYKNKGVPIVGEVALFRQYSQAPIVGITGTNGKSSVTTLLSDMLTAAGKKIATGGNFKTLAMDLISVEEPELYLLELSSFQLESLSELPLKAAAILNITADHMDRYASITAYSKAKQNIYRFCEHAIVNEETLIDSANINKNAHVIKFSLKTPQTGEFGIMQHNKKCYLAFGKQRLICFDELPVNGKHHYENMLAALALGYALDIPFEIMLGCLRNYKSLPFACELILKHKQISWYNDSKAVNVAACLNALNYVGAQTQGKIILIAGGFYRPTDFKLLQTSVNQYVKHLILLGASAAHIADALINETEVSFVKSMQEAVVLAESLAETGDSVLLAPACASYDMFTNYKHRGNEFVTNVQTLLNIQP